MKSFTTLEGIIKQAVAVVGIKKIARELEMKPEGLYKWMSGKCAISLGRAEKIFKHLEYNHHSLLSTLYSMS